MNKARLEREIDNLPIDARFRERKIHDMTLRLDGLYDTIVELEERIEDAKLRRSSIEMEAITLDNIYKLMLNFGKLYDIISDEEKKNLITYLIKEIQIYPNGESEMPLKSIEFNFPIYRDGQEVRRLLWEKGNTVETFAVLLSMTLPQQGAFDVLAAIQANPALWHVPVLVTLPQDEALERQALRAGADDFIKKPHTQVGLRKRLELLTGLSTHKTRERTPRDHICRDYLTGLLNRRGLHTALDSLWREDLPLALYIFDLGGLKKVSDGCGHDHDSQLLKAFGELLRRRTRNGDILCRYGGDEFVVILRRMDNAEAVRRKGTEICRAIGEFLPGVELLGSCSAGAVLCGDEECPFSELLEKATKALYRAKRLGKGTCCLWHDEAEKDICL